MDNQLNEQQKTVSGEAPVQPSESEAPAPPSEQQAEATAPVIPQTDDAGGANATNAAVSQAQSVQGQQQFYQQPAAQQGQQQFYQQPAAQQGQQQFYQQPVAQQGQQQFYQQPTAQQGQQPIYQQPAAQQGQQQFYQQPVAQQGQQQFYQQPVAQQGQQQFYQQPVAQQGQQQFYQQPVAQQGQQQFYQQPVAQQGQQPIYQQPVYSANGATSYSYAPVEPVKKHTGRNILIALIAIVLVIAIVVAAVIGSGALSSVNRTNTNNSNDVKSVSEIESIADLSVGDHVLFGTYEQDNNASNGEEQIEWRVLAIEDGKALIVTEYLLDYMAFSDDGYGYWDSSDLREWMNGDFLSDSFTDEEQEQVAVVTIGGSYSTSLSEGETQDQIFALSADEAEEYFADDDDRIAYTTNYAHSYDYDYSDRTDYYWLRTIGASYNGTAVVDAYGEIDTDGIYSDSINIAVRPALWLDLGGDTGNVSDTDDSADGDTGNETNSASALTALSDITSADELSVGDHVSFGTYEQDNNASNGEEQIEWRVLAIEDGKALIISEYLLDYVAYDEDLENATWEESALRKWMNDDFLNAAFDEDGQQKIAETAVTNDNNPDYDTDGGNDTTDKFFALSLDEVYEYLPEDDDRIAYMTDYVNSLYYNSYDLSEWWWLRSAGEDQSTAAVVDDEGYVYTSGINIYNSLIAARPACWVTLG